MKSKIRWILYILLLRAWGTILIKREQKEIRERKLFEDNERLANEREMAEFNKSVLNK